MAKSPYERFEQSDLILRDELAIDRTLLANERTLLAYLRSAAALLIVGISMIHFSNEDWFHMTGLICIPGAVLVSLIGLLRFRKMNNAILIARTKSKEVDTQMENLSNEKK
jgi:putative membrane protein